MVTFVEKLREIESQYPTDEETLKGVDYQLKIAAIRAELPLFAEEMESQLSPPAELSETDRRICLDVQAWKRGLAVDRTIAKKDPYGMKDDPAEYLPPDFQFPHPVLYAALEGTPVTQQLEEHTRDWEEEYQEWYSTVLGDVQQLRVYPKWKRPFRKPSLDEQRRIIEDALYLDEHVSNYLQRQIENIERQRDLLMRTTQIPERIQKIISLGLVKDIFYSRRESFSSMERDFWHNSQNRFARILPDDD